MLMNSQPHAPRSPRRALYALPILLIILSLACSMPGVQRPTPTPPASRLPPTTAPLPTPTQQPLPPALVETVPTPGSEIPLDGPVTLYFNQPMQRASVEAALRGQPVAASLDWSDDATLVLRPASPLKPQSEVNIRLDESARSAGGLALTQPVSLTFRTAGYLRLTQSLPEASATDVDPTSAVVAAFNRPVVALGAEQAGLPPAFTLDPAAEGRGEWINTSTYIFYPLPALEGGKTYTVKINAGLTSIDGSPLEETPSWSFTTALPRLLSLEPATGGRNIRLDAKFKLTFNQPMDPPSTQASFTLTSAAGPVAGDFSWNDDGSVLTFTPESLLQHSTAYTLSLSGQAQARGGTPLGSDFQATLQSVDPLAVLAISPGPNEILQQYQGITLVFTSPILEKDVLSSITISPTVSNLNYYYDEETRAITLYGMNAPNTSYTVSVAPKLVDPWGGAMTQPFSSVVRTAPASPGIFLTTPSDVLFLTPQDASLQAQATNMPSVSLSVGSAPLADVFTMLSPSGYDFRQNYRPADQRMWVQQINPAPDTSQKLALSLTPEGGPLAPGLYAYRLNIPQSYGNNVPYILVVSNAHLTYKISSTEALVWAVDLRTNTPVANAPITIYDEAGSVLGSGQTDADGVFQRKIPPQNDLYALSYAVLGQPGSESFSLAVSNWDQGVASWDFSIPSDFRPPHVQAYLYSDRPIYRPGQTIYFRAIVRQAYNGRYSPADLGSLSLKLMNANGEEVQDFDLPLSPFGSAHGQYTLPEDAQPGYYNLFSDTASLNIQVANYRKPEINLQVSFPTEQALAGETLTGTVNARYFFDAPAGNTPVHWAVYAAPASFFLPDYQVGTLDTNWLDGFPRFGFDPLGNLVTQGDAETAPDGSLTLPVTTTLPAASSTGLRRANTQLQRYTLEVTATDESGLPVSARASVEVNPAAFYIGAQPDNWVGSAGKEAGFAVQVVDWEKNPAGARALHAEFQTVEWTRQDPGDGSPPTYTPKYTPIASADLSTNDQGQARLAFTPPDPGTYQLTLTGQPPDGEGARTEILLWVQGAGEAVWPNLPRQRLRLTTDKEEYLPGDTAQVFAPNPFGEAVPALVTVERGTILRHEVVTLDAGGSSLPIQLSSDDAPNVYVSVTLIGKTAEGRPDFRQGYTGLAVSPQERVLNVTLASQPQKAGPGDEVTFDVLATGSDGKPVQAEFSLSVVDLAVLALADPNAPDIVPAFYGQQPLGVRTGIALAAYGQRLTLPAPGEGGGGGGGADVAFVVRESFPDTAYWNAEVVTGPDGKASVTITLPDSLTTWQVDLRGTTEDTRVGQAQAQVVTTKDLIVRPATPRFLVVDDHVMLAAVIQNNTGGDLQTQVSIQASGVELDDPASAEQQVSVPANGRARAEWWGTVQDVPGADLVFAVQAGGLQDAARPAGGALPVLRYTARQAFATSGVLEGGDSRLELVSLPRSYEPRGGSLNVELSPSLAAAMMKALDALEHSPYECTEQALSRFLPNLEAVRALQQFGLESPELRARLDRSLPEGLTRLLARQNEDGGWAWWPGGASDPYVTAYVLLGLTRAQEAGVSFNEEAIQRAQDFLWTNPADPREAKEDWELDRIAFIFYVLSERNVGATLLADSLYDQRDRLNPWAQAFLALTLENLSPGSEQARNLISNLETTAVRSASGAHWEMRQPDLRNMITSLTNSAIVVYALAQRDPGSPLLADAVRFLMAHRQADGAWGSTYATAWTLMAAVQVMQGTGELGGDFAFQATLNGAPLASGQASGAGQLTPVNAESPLSSLYPDSPNALSIQRVAGPGRLYYNVALDISRAVEAVAPLQDGISISRNYYSDQADCPQGVCTPLKSARAGERITVRLALTLPDDAYYIMVEDYIPAGAEILDTSLKSTQQGEGEGPEAGPLYDPRQPFSSGWGWWLFNPARIYDDHIAWSADYLPAGSYELTYTLATVQPGEYRVLPAHAWQFYFPDVQGNSAGEVFTIGP